MAAHGNDWMPLYIGDYLRDTGRLTAAEHGAYLLLIMDYWVNGPPPDDDRQLATIARTPLPLWRRDRRGILQKYFTIQGHRWVHKRIEIERARASELSEKKRRGGLASAEARRSQKGTAQPEHRSEHRSQRVRDSVRAPLHLQESSLPPHRGRENSLSPARTRETTPPLPSQGDGGAASRSATPKARDGYSDDLISPEEKAAALAEVHRAIAAAPKVVRPEAVSVFEDPELKAYGNAAFDRCLKVLRDKQKVLTGYAEAGE